MKIKAIAKTLLRKLRYTLADWRLQRIDTGTIPDDPDEIRLFLVVIDEFARLLFLFDYYRNLGVDRLFVIHNDYKD